MSRATEDFQRFKVFRSMSMEERSSASPVYLETVNVSWLRAS
jgi:hypothetical protein